MWQTRLRLWKGSEEVRGGLLALALAGHVSAPSRSRARVRASGATGQKCSGETQSDVSSMKSRMTSATEASWSTSIVSSSPPDSVCWRHVDDVACGGEEMVGRICGEVGREGGSLGVSHTSGTL